jgi:hypothetical protein
MRRERESSVVSRLFWGLMLLSAGTIFWLDRLGRVEARDFLQWWPFVAVVAGVVELVQRRWSGGFFWLAFGSFFLLPHLGVSRFSFFYIIGAWPLFISVAGVTLIAHVLRRPARQQRGPTFSSAAFMGAHNRVVRSEGLAGGEVVAVMAGCEIEFTPTKTPQEIELDALVMWGGVEIRVPIGWRVVSSVTPILGGYDDKTAAGAGVATTLVIRGAVIMGGIDVKNSKELA